MSESAAMAIFVGIDGGATKTACVVGDESRVLGTSLSGGSSIVRSGRVRTRASLQTAIREACASAKVNAARVERTCIGVAGTSVPGVKNAIVHSLAEVLGGEIVVVGDNEIAFEAAHDGASGVIVASGTGSIAYGRNARGETARAGGYGFAISDEGSGYWIGRAAVSAALRAFDTGVESVLMSRFIAALKVESRQGVIKIANGVPACDFAGLFPVVAQAAKSGDAVAVDVLRRAAAELAELGAIIVRKLWPSGDGAQVRIVGGVFQNSPLVRETFRDRMGALYPEATVDLSVVDPVMGALSLARKGAGVRVTS
jgi:N-acetylglucosamine kinase-like BadF-type ATPase